MSDNLENTLTAYLGPEFQQKLMWQLLVEPEFAEKTIPQLAVEYFDDPYLKKLFIIILEYIKEYEKVPNMQNLSIHQAINKYKTPNNPIEEESLFAVIRRLQLWNERILNKEMLHDGDVVQKTTNDFIKQQEYRKLGEYIIAKTKSGDIKQKYTLGHIEEKVQKIMHIGDDEDYGIEVTDNIERVLRKEFRQTIPTGVGVIDVLTGGGLGKGEIGVILTPSGVGKTTLLTKIANTAYEEDKNVLQIVFEDTVEQIQRKHFTIWSKVPLSQIDENNDYVKERAYQKANDKKSKGHLIVRRFSQENTTMMDIRNWIVRYQKKFGIKFDLVVLDYLDCLDSHKKTSDRNEAELVIIKSFESMASDFDIPAWTAIQSNRSGFDAEFVEAYQSGGNIKRVQKAHFFMSVAKTPAQKEAHLANIRIIKARFAQDGQTFTDCIFNNDTMDIIIDDARYSNTKAFRELKKYGDEDINRVEKLADSYNQNIIHTKVSEVLIDKTVGDEKFTIDNNETEGLTDKIKYAFGNVLNKIPIDDFEKRKTNTELLDWSGETFTENSSELPEVTFDIIPPIDEKLLELDEKDDISSEKIPKINKIEEINTGEKQIIFDDPDEPPIEHQSVFQMLNKIGLTQSVVKKE